MYLNWPQTAQASVHLPHSREVEQELFRSWDLMGTLAWKYKNYSCSLYHLPAHIISCSLVVALEKVQNHFSGFKTCKVMLKLVSELEKGQNFTETAAASVNVNNLPCHTGWKSSSPPSWTPPQPPCPHRTGEPPAPTSRTSWGRSCTQSTGDSSAPWN